MRGFRVRVFLSESNFMDIVITANSWFNAKSLGEGQSPIGKAIFLGEA
jgi:hypothetical protein